MSGSILRGTAARDTLTGTPGVTTLLGMGGDDVLDARGGGTVLDGGAGDDTLIGGAGSQVFRGGAGHDLLRVGTLADLLNLTFTPGLGWLPVAWTRDTIGMGQGDTLDLSGTGLAFVEALSGPGQAVVGTTNVMVSYATANGWDSTTILDPLASEAGLTVCLKSLWRVVGWI